MSEQLTAVEAPPAPETATAQPAPAQTEEKVTVDAAAAEAEAETHKAAGKRKAGDDARKRRTPSPRPAKSDKTEGEETESEPEKQPKKRAKTAAKGAKRGPGRRKKVAAVEPAPDSDDEQREVERKVAALSDDVKGRFGQVVWAKMGGYPYWPCIITDPRLLPRKLQDAAVKVLETKFLVFFFVSNNFAPVSFKMIEPWDDTKFNYREGHPEKDSKAPKRRVKLMAAIEVADKEIKLPIEERADGLLKPEEKTEEVDEPADEAPAPVKRKPGRPPKNKTGAKPAPKKTPKKRQPKEENAEEATGVNEGKEAAVATTQEEEEDAAGPTLSKEEIKAKVASRKTPKKKGADDAVNAAGASAKKAPKAAAKHAKSNGSEIDSKRKKEIELVVPHKSVKSADIREMTEEAAKKKLSGPKLKTKKDKGEYRVGDLAPFASKMARLHANESTRNNDELVAMMQELFKESRMYRSDVERSGLAAIIAILRKSMSPTVGQAASALRKHMIKILDHDTDVSHLGKKNHDDAAAHGIKKRKAENGDSVKGEEHQNKPTSETPSTPAANGDAEEKSTAQAKPPPAKPPSPSKKTDDATPKSEAVATKDEKTATKEEKTTIEAVKTTTKEEKTVTKEEKKTITKEEKRPVGDATVKNALSGDAAVKTESTAEKAETITKDKQPASPTKEAENSTDVVKDKEDIFEAPEHVDKNRKIFAEMLSKILDHEGSTRGDLAQEIEAALFERFKESNDDYLTQARIIIFGLKENAPMRERLFSGALHCLEFAYADDAFFKAE